MIKKPQTAEEFDLLDRSNRLEDGFREVIEKQIGTAFLEANCTKDEFESAIQTSLDAIFGLVAKISMLRIVNESARLVGLGETNLEKEMADYCSTLCDQMAEVGESSVVLAIEALADMTNRPISN